MAFTTLLLTVSLVATASGAFPGWPANDNPFPGFHSPMMSLRFGPIASPPSMPGMPTFPQNFPFFQLPSFSVFPTMPSFPSLPSVSDIANAVPANGGTFTGVVVSSKSESKRKEDGTIVKESGSTILTNTDGVISVKKTGNNPPDLPTKRQTVQTEFDSNAPKIKPSNPTQFKKNNFKFEDIFDFHHKFRTIDPKEIEDYVPGEGQTFKGHSIRTHTFSTNDNGQVSAGGSATRIDNDNGHVHKEIVSFSNDGTHSTMAPKST